MVITISDKLARTFGKAVYRKHVARRYGITKVPDMAVDADLTYDLLQIYKREKELEDCGLPSENNDYYKITELIKTL